jgi:hypothetical protein
LPILVQDVTLELPVVASGVWNAVLIWFEADMGTADGGPGGAAVASWGEGRSGVPVGRSWMQGVQYIDGISVTKVAGRGVRSFAVVAEWVEWAGSARSFGAVAEWVEWRE